MKKPILVGGPGSVEDSIVALSRALFRGNLTEDQVRALPAQSLYFAVKEIGLESAHEVLEVVSRKQYSSLLDFEFWTRDSFREDRFWTWVETIDDHQDLQPVQKFLACVDSTVLAFLINKYVEVAYNEEPTDLPPGPNFYTPDAGSTWICIKAHDPERHRLFGKLLAFIYQTNIDFFYRLILQAREGTTIEFEEIGYKEKGNRLLNDDVPLFEDAEPFNRSLNPYQFLKELKEKTSEVVEENSYQLVKRNHGFYQGVKYQPFLSALEEVTDERLYEIQNEIARILNCAVIFFVNDFGEEVRIKFLSEQVFGAINVGLQALVEKQPEIISRNGLENLKFSDVYRVGLYHLYDLRSLAQKIPDDVLETLSHMNQPLALMVENLRKAFPSLPAFIREDGSFEVDQDKMEASPTVIYSMQQITSAKELLTKQIIEKAKEIRSYESSGKKHSISDINVTNETQ